VLVRSVVNERDRKTIGCYGVLESIFYNTHGGLQIESLLRCKIVEKHFSDGCLPTSTMQN
jgi:hypothetical protein